MIPQILKSLLGTRNSRLLKKYQPLVEKINGLEKKYQSLEDANFPDQTKKLKDLYQSSNDLDGLLPEAFAVVREASWRTIGLRHYDVQLIGGIVLHNGKSQK